ncbi:MAG TPA: hypothetical protein VFA31_02950 [Candidatus Polarisedimenticolia bacterium]|nr:hypothetical protein [Candidatus Polarisedimenticolia bacterium]
MGFHISTLLLTATLVIATAAAGPAKAALAVDLQATTTIYLPNIVKMLGGADGWNTPFIVQNVGTASTNLTFDFRRFSDGALVKSRTVAGLAPGTSVFHAPNADGELAAGGQYSVVIKSFGSPVVAVVNEHQNEANPQRQEALSYDGLTSGSTKVFLPYVAALAGGFYCTVITQNLGSGLASVTATFTSYDGLKTSQLTRAISSGGSQFIDPRFESNLVAGTEYGVAMTSTQPIGVVVNCHNDDASVPAPRAFSYNGVLASNEIRTFAPYVAKNVSGRTSRVLVQNTGTAAAQPVMFIGSLGGPISSSINGPASLAPGAIWAYDFGASPFPDGERSVYIRGGQFAVLVDTRSATTAMAFTGNSDHSTRVYLPNITRTLGGPSGWTTPIVVQSQGAFVATMKWYRFADGVLVYTQPVNFGGFFRGMSQKIDPRSLPQLSDDTQYAVTIEAAEGGVGAVVLELNDRGGDSAMAYEGMAAAPTASFGTSSCTPTVDAWGSVFRCRLYGLPPGATPLNYALTVPGAADFTRTITDEAVASDGSWSIDIWAGYLGLRTLTVTAGGVSKSASFTLSSPTFGLQITQHQNGSITATTKPGAYCAAYATLPDNSFVNSAALDTVKIADAVGKVSWTYPAQPGGGTGTQNVECNFGAETQFDSAQYTLP